MEFDDGVHGHAKRNEVEALRRLLDDEPELLEQPHGAKTPLYYACRAGSMEAARLLVERGARLETGSN